MAQEASVKKLLKEVRAPGPNEDSSLRIPRLPLHPTFKPETIPSEISDLWHHTIVQAFDKAPAEKAPAEKAAAAAEVRHLMLFDRSLVLVLTHTVRNTHLTREAHLPHTACVAMGTQGRRGRRRVEGLWFTVSTARQLACNPFPGRSHNRIRGEAAGRNECTRTEQKYLPLDSPCASASNSQTRNNPFRDL